MRRGKENANAGEIFDLNVLVDHATPEARKSSWRGGTKNIGRSRRDNWTESETQERRELPDLEYFLERTHTHTIYMYDVIS